jgi:uncharacterized phage-like protein YoqJ
MSTFAGNRLSEGVGKFGILSTKSSISHHTDTPTHHTDTDTDTHTHATHIKKPYYISIIGNDNVKCNDNKTVLLLQAFNQFMRECMNKFQETHDLIVLTGLNTGFDSEAIKMVKELNIPYIAVLPVSKAVLPVTIAEEKEQFCEEEKLLLQELLHAAKDTVIINSSGSDKLSKENLFARNKWMIDKCDIVFAFQNFDNEDTGIAIDYGKHLRRPMVVITPQDLE